jgi:UDP-3-O-[3-hydroxymyristoyl] glucosamine N-acyltransferase
MPLTAADIAKHLQGEVLGDGSVHLTGFAAAAQSKPGDLTFAENKAYFEKAEESSASAILVGKGFASSKKILIRVPNARVATAKALSLFYPPSKFVRGIHSSSVVAKSARIDPSAHIGPHCVLGEAVSIGPRTVLEGGNHIGADCEMGQDVHLFPQVTLYAGSQLGNRITIHAGTVIGSDGFGYVLDQGRQCKVPQVGNVIIHDDVEIGANVTIDRGALGSTVIGKGAKIDNLVQIAHNVVIGEHCIIVSQVGIAGSTRLGNYVTLAGQVGIAGHLHLGNKATVAAQAGVMNSIPDGEKWFGSPARPSRQMKRIYIAMDRLPALIQRVADLEKRLGKIDTNGQH